MKTRKHLALTGLGLLGLACVALAEDPPATRGEHYATEYGAALRDATDLVFERFDVVQGVDHGKPYLRVQATIRELVEGQAGPATMVVERVLVDGDREFYLVRPRHGAGQPGAGIGRSQETAAQMQLLDAAWGKTYTFVVLNFTGGTSARHAGVSTFVVPLTK